MNRCTVGHNRGVLNVGLTGGIGAGKSAVSSRLAELGVIVIDSDALAREVVMPETPGHAEVVQYFGPAVIGNDGQLNRSALADRVFHDAEARAKLESIIHPRVAARSAQLKAQAPEDAIVLNDVPLLVEVGMAPTFDLVIVVTAARALRIERLKLRGLDAEHAHARIAAQAPDEQREAAADALIDNSSSLESLTHVVNDLYSNRLAPFERNKRQRHTVCDSADHVGTVSGRSARLRARLTHVLGMHAESVDTEPGCDGAVVATVLLTTAAASETVYTKLETAGFFRSTTSAGVDRFCGTDPHNPCQVLLRRQ